MIRLPPRPSHTLETGNVRRVVTRQEPAVASRKGELNGLDGGRRLRDGSVAASGVLAHYEATRFEYACNGVVVTYAMGESWDADVTDPATVLNPHINWAREFRYDGARARYLNKQLDPGPLETLPTAFVADLPGGQSVETYYDGNEPYADRPGSLPWTLFAPGIARVEGYDPFAPPVGSVNTDYYHSDMLGTMRTMSSPAGGTILDFNGGYAGVDTVYTAFGEQVVNTFADGASNRYGYVGALGYQTQDSGEMPFLHVGARYYDPATGRFLQRDPIGVSAGPNVYAYVGTAPTRWVDPTGTEPLPPLTPGNIFRKPIWLPDIVDTTLGRLGGYASLCWGAWKLGSAIGDFFNKRFDLPNKIGSVFATPSPPGPGPIGCFVAGTLVASTTGETTIDQLCEGDSIPSLDMGNMAHLTEVVTKTMSFFVIEVVDVSVEDETIETTANHPFWVMGRGWVKARNLTPGDHLQDIGGHGIVIRHVAVRKLDRPIRVFNITVSGTSTYYIGIHKILVQ